MIPDAAIGLLTFYVAITVMIVVGASCYRLTIQERYPRPWSVDRSEARRTSARVVVFSWAWPFLTARYLWRAASTAVTEARGA